MKRLALILGRTDFQVTVGALFLLLVTWPLWTSKAPSHTFLFVFAAWAVVTALLGLITALGKHESTDRIVDEDIDEGGEGHQGGDDA